jgi:hypothetical protein
VATCSRMEETASLGHIQAVMLAWQVIAMRSVQHRAGGIVTQGPVGERKSHIRHCEDSPGRGLASVQSPTKASDVDVSPDVSGIADFEPDVRSLDEKLLASASQSFSSQSQRPDAMLVASLATQMRQFAHWAAEGEALRARVVVVAWRKHCGALAQRQALVDARAALVNRLRLAFALAAFSAWRHVTVPSDARFCRMCGQQFPQWTQEVAATVPTSAVAVDICVTTSDQLMLKKMPTSAVSTTPCKQDAALQGSSLPASRTPSKQDAALRGAFGNALLTLWLHSVLGAWWRLASRWRGVLAVSAMGIERYEVAAVTSIVYRIIAEWRRRALRSALKAAHIQFREVLHRSIGIAWHLQQSWRVPEKMKTILALWRLRARIAGLAAWRWNCYILAVLRASLDAWRLAILNQRQYTTESFDAAFHSARTPPGPIQRGPAIRHASRTRGKQSPPTASFSDSSSSSSCSPAATRRAVSARLPFEEESFMSPAFSHRRASSASALVGSRGSEHKLSDGRRLMVTQPSPLQSHIRVSELQPLSRVRDA